MMTALSRSMKKWLEIEFQWRKSRIHFFQPDKYIGIGLSRKKVPFRNQPWTVGLCSLPKSVPQSDANLAFLQDSIDHFSESI